MMNQRLFSICPAVLAFGLVASFSAVAEEGAGVAEAGEQREAAEKAEKGGGGGGVRLLGERSAEQAFAQASGQLGEVRELAGRGQVESARQRIGEVLGLLEAIREVHPQWRVDAMQQRMEEARETKQRLGRMGGGPEAEGEVRRRMEFLEEELRRSRQREASLRAVIRDLIQQLDGGAGMAGEGPREGRREGLKPGEPRDGGPRAPVPPRVAPLPVR